MIITKGERGMSIFERDGSIIDVPTLPVEGEVDITGAGDTVTSVMTLSLCSGVDLIHAAIIANLAARITVKKIGITGTASKDEILMEFDQVKDRLEEVRYVRS